MFDEAEVIDGKKKWWSEKIKEFRVGSDDDYLTTLSARPISNPLLFLLIACSNYKDLSYKKYLSFYLIKWILCIKNKKKRFCYHRFFLRVMILFVLHRGTLVSSTYFSLMIFLEPFNKERLKSHPHTFRVAYELWFRIL